jgi:class 3 adenylate cyclase/tetratricopeptide (TPR) repeat protein
MGVPVSLALLAVPAYTRWVTRCPQCGQENRAEARFCDACGVSLDSALVGREERKVVSVLFADLVGFTAAAEGLDPEDVRAVQEPYWRHVRAEIERHGGTVEKFIGDAVVGLLGAPVAHEDDAERAVRAALTVRDWAQEQEAIQVRIAVTTGEALVALGARPLTGEGMTTGDVVNTASRLQGHAPVNGVVVDERTFRATSHAIDYREAEAVVAKGKERPVAIWEAIQARSRFGVDLVSHGRTPLVGRARELELTLATLARARAESTPQLLTIVGVPGIGKSRLVYELMQAVAADPSAIVTWRQGRSPPYGDGVTFWALAEIVKADAGILETDPNDVVGEKLARTVRQVVEDEAEAVWVDRHLRPLIGLGESGDLSGGRRAESAAAWRRFFEAHAEGRPLVLVFEDLHWADDGLLDFVDGLVEWVTHVPMLVVATARPELLERRPNWGGGKANATTLSLSALSEEETERLVSALLEQSLVGADMRATVSANAGGNALYAEQYVRMLGERGHGEELPMPETVHGIIAARLDALPESEKTLLQDAAVYGKVFWDGAVLALDGIEREAVGERLHGLDRKEFIERARRSSVAGESEYSFRHVLFRDVAYSQIPRSVRAEKHGRAAAWIDSLGRSEDHAEMLAHHYLSALELAEAAGESTSELVSRARDSLVRAGDRALSVNAFKEAAAYYQRALELSPETRDQRARMLWGYARSLFASGADAGAVLEQARTALHESGETDSAAEADAMLAAVWWNRGQRQEVDAHLDRALALTRDRPRSPAKAHVLSAVARFRMLTYRDNQEAIALARETLALAEALDLQDLRADTLVTLGTARWNDGDAEGVADIEDGLRIAVEHNALSAAMRAYNNLATVAGDKGESSRTELLVQAHGVATRLGSRDQARFIEGQLLSRKLDDGAWDDALRSATNFIAECESGSAHRSEQIARTVRARIYFARDDVDAAWAECEKALSLARATHDAQWLGGTLGDVMVTYTQADRLGEAKALADEILSSGGSAAAGAFVALAWVNDLVGLDSQELEPLLHSVPAHFFWRRIAELVLAAEFEEVAEMLARTGYKDIEAGARVRAANALLSQKRLDEADAQLRRALAFFRSVGATRYIREAERLRAAISREREEAGQPRA